MVKDITVNVNVAPLSQVIEVRRNFTDAELLEFGKKFADSLSTRNNKESELKEFAKNIKDDILALDQIIDDCGFNIEKGYEMQSVPCVVTYDGNLAIFTSKESGEVIEKRELTKEEQLRLSGKWVDADQVIREDSEKE